MESPEPVRRLRKKEGVTSVPVEFWTCSRVEVRQYSLVLFVSLSLFDTMLYNLRLISGASGCVYFVIVVEHL